MSMLNKKTQYAFQALMYLAEHKNDGPVLIADIAKKKKIPLKFLENILLELRKSGILDGPIAMLPCASLYFYERCKNCDEKNCGLHDTMILVRDATLKILENKTVADLIQK